MTAVKMLLAACSLLALAGVADLASARGKPGPAPPPPTYPPARYWHAFTSNAGELSTTSRLYMFGGTGGVNSSLAVYNDLWVYTNAGSSDAAWTRIPNGSSSPGPRSHLGWSCGAGRCVAANGSNGVGALKETWVFSELPGTWSKVNCKRFLCPSARFMTTMAYDPLHGTHVLFGGRVTASALSDTYAFDAATMTWAGHVTDTAPPARSRAAAVFVPQVGRIVMFGGQQDFVRALDDMYSWSGVAWEPISYLFADPTMTRAPSLHSHTIAWDPVGQRLVVAGGFVDMVDSPNPHTWYVSFARRDNAWSATWELAKGVGCQATAGSVDAVPHRDARMAYDAAARVQVFFGGAESDTAAYDNTVECQ